jgi:alkanesulfonate monooxygenase SsuD/methylene tetrahydromethanopterin reductase-like flavin-dependent oxidoreductase (luciferase family)
MIHAFGVNFRAPLSHLREYLRILKSLLQQGNVDFEGSFYIARGEIDAPIDVPVMASALRRRSYELCGEEADGAISWVCPSAYLRDSALPSMTTAAERAGRPTPPLIAHAIVAVDEDADAVRQAVREQMGLYVTLPFYAQMFVDAGFPEAQSGEWSDEMIDAVAIHGSVEQVQEGVRRLFSYGVTEIIASPVLTGADAEASWERTVSALAGIEAG